MNLRGITNSCWEYIRDIPYINQTIINRSILHITPAQRMICRILNLRGVCERTIKVCRYFSKIKILLTIIFDKH